MSKTDWYINLRNKIRNAKTDDELYAIIDEIYEEGQEDTEQEYNNDGESEPSFDWNDLD